MYKVKKTSFSMPDSMKITDNYITDGYILFYKKYFNTSLIKKNGKYSTLTDNDIKNIIPDKNALTQIYLDRHDAHFDYKYKTLENRKNNIKLSLKFYCFLMEFINDDKNVRVYTNTKYRGTPLYLFVDDVFICSLTQYKGVC